MKSNHPIVVVLLADGFEEIEAVTMMDLLRRADAEVIACGIGGKQVVGSHGIPVVADVTFEGLPTNWDALLLPGGIPGATNLAKSSKVVALLRQTFQRDGLVAAICASPAVVLGGAGLLKGRTYTCYPGFEEGLKEGVFNPQRVVIDGNLITSRGPGTSAEFSDAVIRRLCGDDVAAEVWRQTLQR